MTPETQAKLDTIAAYASTEPDSTKFSCLESIAMLVLVVALAGMVGVWALV